MTSEAAMRTPALLLPFVALLLAAVMLAPARAAERNPMDHFFHPFLGDLRDEIAQAKSAGKQGVMVMYHFDDCPACQRMKKQVLSKSEVQDWYRAKFVLVPIDTRGAQPITGLDGRTVSEKEYGSVVSIRGTPTFDFYGPDGSRLYRHVGGIFEPAVFLLLGEFVASGAYRSQSFADYRQTNPRKGS